MTDKTTFNFDAPPSRYDEEIAAKGTEVPVADEQGNYRGTWIMTLRDETDQRYRAAESRYYKTNGNRLRGIKEEHLRNMDRLVELCVKGWKDIKAGGKDVPFSKEAAKAYLSQEWAYYDLNYLWHASAMTALFQKDETTKEDTSGN